MSKYITILCTVPDSATGEIIAKNLVDTSLAACVNIVPGITSIYKWEGETAMDDELLLIIKSTTSQFDSIKERIIALHSYEVPEVIALDISHGLDGYLQWISESTTGR